ncbi:hypothetical protein GR183_05790 [Stappia sp. GBMRC 2046]|uniref:D-isomer specific 2-hydroxyacid dehydrogenase NAD-binding domain-containing protein n=1 Tax=Stappia sediminis TaxID=2692190 RepID=A0A7X3S758_9HYPH|nr:NAD(P)-dependent oxidoreductase [Stappia sediminis]MXN64409.1 hypothetical protein [Stappia sediminis]
MTLKPVCLILDQIHPAGVEWLEQAGIEPALAWRGETAPRDRVRAIITRRSEVGSGLMAAYPMLNVVVVHGSGTDGIDKQTARQRGIAIDNTAGTNAQSVAEHCLALVLAMLRQVPQADAAMRQGDKDFRDRERIVSLSDIQYGVYGYGNTGRAMASLARAVGASVVVHAREKALADAAKDGFRVASDVCGFLRQIDVLSLHVPLTQETRGLIGGEEISRMKQGAFLVNAARAGIVDEAALARALNEGKLAGAAVDTLSGDERMATGPLAQARNCILSPHLAGSGTLEKKVTALEAAKKALAHIEDLHDLVP